MNDVLRALNQRPIAYYPIYVAGTGSVCAAVALSQIMYYFGLGKDKIEKTDTELRQETGLSDKEMRTVKKRLKELPFLKITREGVPAKTYYEIDWEKYKSSLSEWYKLDWPKGTNWIGRKVQTYKYDIYNNNNNINNNKKNKERVATIVDDARESKKPSKTMAEAIEVANYLNERLARSIENYKRPSKETIFKWAKDIDKAIRLDKRTKEQLIEKINWIHDNPDPFWIGNIQSGKKLREKFDTLTAQQARDNKNVSIKQRALEAFGKGNVFFSFIDKKNDNRLVKVCLYGEYGALYAYNLNEYIPKEQASKVWKAIEKNFDKILKAFQSRGDMDG